MHQRFQVREPNSWVPLLFIFGTVLYAVVEVMDRGLGALTFWFFVTAVEVGVFLFLFQRNYVELRDGHLTWVKWGHKQCKIAFSEIRQVTSKGTLVNVLLSNASPLPRFSVFRRAAASSWLTIPAVDPQGLMTSVENAVRAYGGSDTTAGVRAEGPPAPPDIELVPADRWRRLLAAALDAFVLVSLLCTVSLAKTAHLEEGEKPDGVGLYALVVVIAWVAYLWIANIVGVSLGKLPFGLRVVRFGTDQAPGPLRGTVRLLAALSGFAIALLALFFIAIPVFYVGMAVLSIEYLWSFVDSERRALHDIAARTRVTRTAYRLEADRPQAVAE